MLGAHDIKNVCQREFYYRYLFGSFGGLRRGTSQALIEKLFLLRSGRECFSICLLRDAVPEILDQLEAFGYGQMPEVEQQISRHEGKFGSPQLPRSGGWASESRRVLSNRV